MGNIYLIIFWILNTLDTLTTWYAISHRFAREGNPFMRYVIENTGWVGFFIIKFLMGTCLVWFLWNQVNKIKPLQRILLFTFGIVGYTIVVTLNSLIIFFALYMK